MAFKNEKVIAIDVDNVVVNLMQQWYDWMRAIAPDVNVTLDEVSKEYDFHIPFKNFVTQDEAWHFWKQRGLYDHAVPVTGAVECIKKLRDDFGFKIVFVSHCEGDHAKSKYDFLARNFEFDGFMATREKGFVRCDIAIDDRLEHLACHKSHVYTVQMATPHRQTKALDFKPDYVMKGWDTSAVQDILMGWLNDRIERIQEATGRDKPLVLPSAVHHQGQD